MRTASLHPLQANLFAVLMTTIKIIIPLLILLYGIFHFNPAHWVILGLVVVASLAISYKVTHINPSHNTNVSVKQNVIHSDGGTFRQAQHPKTQYQVRPVVYDGGIVKSKVMGAKPGSK